ncbi:MAG: hypothetical protein LBB68_04925 [Treponema sp.]|jgi:hypothetical protein|nr:hypothetical protein [Treponema sp.]
MRKAGIFGLAPAAAVFAVFFMGACDLLSNKPDIDVEKAVDGAVRIANAPVLKVEVDEGGMGTAGPRGTLSVIKQGVPFQLNYQANSAYPFYGWHLIARDGTLAGKDRDGVFRRPGGGSLAGGGNRALPERT